MIKHAGMHLRKLKNLNWSRRAISPTYQQSTAYLEKPFVKGIANHTFGGDFSYKWAYITKNSIIKDE